jgi:chromosome segregation ATPase
MTITVSSTTETQEQLQQAADYGLKTGKKASAQPSEVETAEHPEADEAASGAESETAQEEAEQVEAEEEEEEEEEQSAQAPVGKTRKKLLRRLSRLHSENLTLQERLEAAEEKLRKAGGEEPSAAGSAAKPNPKDYKDYEAYVEALTDWKIKQRDLEQAQAAQNEYLKSVFDDYNQQVEAARQTHDDFDEVVGSSVQVPVIAINAMYEMDNGAEVAYYLGQHPEVRAELLEWNQPGIKGGVRKMLAKLDRISEDLSKGTTPSSRSNGSPVRSKPATSAPAPIKPVGTSSTRSTVTPDDLSYQDYKKWYAKRYPGSR